MDNSKSEPSANGISPPNILELVAQLKSRVEDDTDELNRLKSLDDFMHNPSLQALLEVYETIQNDTLRPSEPTSDNAIGLLKELQELSRVFSDNKILEGLTSALTNSPHLLALLECHDRIAGKDYGEPYLNESVDEITNDDESANEESMKVVRLVKADEPLGATIATDEKSGNIVIARILKGGAADRSGLIHVNDIVVEVNGNISQGKKPEDLIEELAGFRGPLTFKLIPGELPNEANDENLYIRAKFAFQPKLDPLIPCPEAGVEFQPRDILKVVAKDDNSWWQAAKIDSKMPLNVNDMSTDRAGLIPSLKLQTRRERLKKQATQKLNDTMSMKGSSASLLSNHRKTAWSVIRSSFRRKRSGTLSKTVATKSAGSKPPEDPYFPPYEVVTQIPSLREAENKGEGYRPRPIVLVGPQGVGRNELKDRLIDSNPSHYGVPVPHTSRSKQADEADGQDYHFVTREFMESGIRENTFLEYGEYRGNLYGTSLDAVRAVMRSQQVCVLTPYPQALSILRTREFRPFIIYVKPPSVEQMRNFGGSVAGGDNNINPKAAIERPMPFSEHELKGLIARGEKMEQTYGRLFDCCVVNDDIDRCFAALKDFSFAAENDPQWVPVDWVS